jgi:hypothetical protein
LTATKTAQEIMTAGGKTVDEIETDTTAEARARAAADFLRSYALFGLLELGLWIGKGVFMAFLYHRWLTHVERRQQTRGKEEGVSHLKRR